MMKQIILLILAVCVMSKEIHYHYHYANSAGPSPKKHKMWGWFRRMRCKGNCRRLHCGYNGYCDKRETPPYNACKLKDHCDTLTH